ncbi:YlxR family protein [Mycolicibacterium baixiangningiae]|uniref:YlxR family protein n=1 Tax=Mycolicibacterium baixiangningiae TaxID=2761578 RepID=UPI00299F71F2|nr:YlxR family protein [Mycolicibacterium baixiangningiae]
MRRPFQFAGAGAVDSSVSQRETSVSPRRSTKDHPPGPVRTCVGCRKRELAAELLRVAAVVDGNGECAAIVDTAGNLPGRGAWLHPREQCLHAAIRRRAFVRALRITGSPDLSAVIEHVENFSAGSPHPAREQVAKNMSTP